MEGGPDPAGVTLLFVAAVSHARAIAMNRDGKVVKNHFRLFSLAIF
jgi:hypothetical protein